MIDLDKLKHWFLSQSRDLPWREREGLSHSEISYRVWVSEVMLQQTQVSVVIPYFLRWMKRFPTLSALASSPLETVLKEWEGLGYYSRARNLLEGAKYVLQHHGGSLPDTAEELKKIKGIGNYTSGAILNFAFGKKAPAIDGNVLRVLARHYMIDGDISNGKTVKRIEEMVLNLLPDHEPWIVSEALIELGATVCTKTAKCTACPLQTSCQAYSQGKTAQYPIKLNQVKTTKLYRSVAIISHRDKFLIKQGEKGKVMADLFEFPYLELKGAINDPKALLDHYQQEHDLPLKWVKASPQVKHSFTRYEATLIPHHFIAEKPLAIVGCHWLSLEELEKRPFSSGHKRILELIQSG